jgi:hypothetical protein
VHCAVLAVHILAVSGRNQRNAVRVAELLESISIELIV